MVVSIHPAGKEDIKRVAQLTQRTNQFNLTTRRYSETDIQAMLQSRNWRIYVLGLKDRFGDNGTVGLAIVEAKAKDWQIDTFLMSCRVIGRQVEDALVDHTCSEAARAGVKQITAEYIKTPKNDLAKEFWLKMGFEKVEENAAASSWRKKLEHYTARKFEYLSFAK